MTSTDTARALQGVVVKSWEPGPDRRDEAVAALPTAAARVVAAADTAGWRWAVQWTVTMSGESPHVTVYVGDDADTEVRLTWHSQRRSRVGGTHTTLALFGAIARAPRRNWHDVTVTDTITVITANPTKAGTP